MERPPGRAVAAHYADAGDLQGRRDMGRGRQYQFCPGGDRLWAPCVVLCDRRLFLGGVLQRAAKAGVCPAAPHPLCSGQGSRWPGHGDHDGHLFHLRQRTKLEQQTKKAEKKLDAVVPVVQDAETFFGNNISFFGDLIPEAGALESAKSYREHMPACIRRWSMPAEILRWILWEALQAGTENAEISITADAIPTREIRIHRRQEFLWIL